MKLIKSYIKAIQYVRSLATFKEENIPSIEYVDETYKGLDNKNTIVRVFKTSNPKAQSIIIFPGASPYAENHPGMIMLGSSLRNVGYNVYLPRIPALKNLILEKENIDWFAHCYQELAQHKIESKNNIMIVGLSYGGASLLRATLDKRMQSPKPKSILSYGTYFSINTALNFFLTGKISYNNQEYHITPHEWGMIVLFYNFIDTIKSKYDQDTIKKLLKYRIEDNDNMVNQIRETLSKENQILVDHILKGEINSVIEQLVHEIIETNSELLNYLSPENWAHNINDKIFIFHGANDSMVPFTESNLLAKQLKNSELLISFVFEHREISTNRGFIFKIKELIKMIKFFAAYFRFNQ